MFLNTLKENMLILKTDTSIKKEIKANSILDFPAKMHKKHPLIVYLHGAGERDASLEEMKELSIRNELNERLNFAILTPHCPPNEIWDADIVTAIIKDAINFGHIDARRIYLTGTSMGARGVWNIATTYPEMFAALLPISGYSYYLKAAKIAKIPTWIWHGSKDVVVPFDESIKMYQTLREYGGTPRFSYWDGGHNGLSGVYEKEAVYTWLLEQKL